MRRTLIVMLLATAWIMTVGCSPGDPDGDGDADGDSDVDADSDADGDGEVEPVCPDDWACCTDAECSDGVFCNGLEICDRGRCEQDPDAFCTTEGVCLISCDDGVECTQDECNEQANLCEHRAQHDICRDGDMCNGEEWCEPAATTADERGCVAGISMVCDDEDPCTEDYCEENECRTRLRDGDGDGHGDDDCEWCDPENPELCERGDDCNDANADVYPGAPELCDDGEDNNCDRVRDYADPACVVPNDSCAAPLLLEVDETVHSSTRGTVADVDSSCSPAGDRDVVFSFVIPSVQDVTIDVAARGGRDVTVALTVDCGNVEADMRCTSGRTFAQINRALPGGTYYVVVSSAWETDFSITLRHEEPAPRPEGDQCATAPDISEGGSFEGTTRGYDPDYEATCGEVTDRDAAFMVRVDETTSMDLRVLGSARLSVAVQSSCGVVATEIDCLTGDPAEGWIRHLAPGTHYIIVKTPTEQDFTIEVSFSPTAADACEHALDASTPGIYRGSTVGMTADIETACGEEEGPDVAYAFRLSEESDVLVDFTSHGEATTLSLTTDCGVPDAEVRCSEGTSFELRGRGLGAGTYYLVATGEAGADFELEIDITEPVPRPPADLCTGAILAFPDRSYSGSTADCENDYESRCGSADDLDVTYRFTIGEDHSLDLDLTAATGPISVALQPDCGVVGTERGCFTASPAGSHHFRFLEAGTYYLVFKTPLPDTFEFEFTLGPPEEGIEFRGYATWSQNVSAQSDAEQDRLMDEACARAFPGSSAATVEEIATGAVIGLPETNTSGNWLVGKCPYCEGRGGWGGAIDGHCRNCINPGNPFPVTLPPDGWHDYCCSSSRSAACAGR